MLARKPYRAGLPNSRRASGHDFTERMERVDGIEPTYAAWNAAVLPLNYTRKGADVTAAKRQRGQELYLISQDKVSSPECRILAAILQSPLKTQTDR